MELTRIIQSPVITEKTDMLMREGQYTFKVDFRANKYQIARAVEYIFNVKVVAVNTIKIGKKPKKLGRFAGFQNRYKKAIVTLASGQSINFFPEDETKASSLEKEAKAKAKAAEKEALSAKEKEVAKRVSEKLANKVATKTNKTVTKKQTTRKVGNS